MEERYMKTQRIESVSAETCVEQLIFVGKELALKLNETFKDDTVKQEMVEFTKGVFDLNVNILNTAIAVGLTFEEERGRLLKIGISSGVLSGFAEAVDKMNQPEE